VSETIEQIFDLLDKTAIVTGGASGIGKSIALRLAEAGASVVICCDMNIEGAKQTVKEIRNNKGKAQAIQADTSKVADAERVVQFTIKEFGDIHILVNNAGIFFFTPFLELSEEMWDRTLDINLKGYAFFSQAAARAMIKAKHGGKIINIASVNSFVPGYNNEAYDASKGGVIMLTKSLALDLVSHGITVTAIAPGPTLTPGVLALTGETTSEEGKAWANDYIQKLMPMRRRGEADEIAKVALFLASSASDFMTGQTVVVDGGRLLI
jgi:2-deoxy-D-gluconate 3-dehydrogenase